MSSETDLEETAQPRVGMVPMSPAPGVSPDRKRVVKAE